MSKIFRDEFKRLTNAKKFVAAYSAVSRYCDNQNKQITAHLERLQWKIPCGDRGCGYCCQRPIILFSKVEDYGIRAALRKVDTKYVFKRNHEAIQCWEEACKMHGVTHPPPDYPSNDYETEVMSSFTRFGGVCPLLDSSGSCIIYNKRPWPCRLIITKGEKCQVGDKKSALITPDVNDVIISTLSSVLPNRTTLFHVIRNIEERFSMKEAEHEETGSVDESGTS